MAGPEGRRVARVWHGMQRQIAACGSAIAISACNLSGAHAAHASEPARSPKLSAPASSAPVLPPPSAATAAAAPSAQPTNGVTAPTTSGEAPSIAQAKDAATSVEALLSLDGKLSTSIGGPSNGHVLGAIAFPDAGPGFYHNTTRPYGARYGTVELVQTIVSAAAVVNETMPGSALTVNDLGLQEGGPIRQHGSHQAGRDADILFYTQDEHGQPVPSVGVPIDPKGKGWDFKDLADPKDDQRVELDVRRTWRFVQALLEIGQEAVQRIFVVEHVRSMLLAEAARSHAPKALITRFEDITCQPEYPHDDHLHLRLFCTVEDMAEGCLDSAPIYPFRSAELAKLGLKPKLASARRSREESEAVATRTTSAAEARKRAGPMDVAVRKFLAEREAWRKRPSPGRPYCK
jgi:penicillin-insensitive murein endopeptidase